MEILATSLDSDLRVFTNTSKHKYSSVSIDCESLISIQQETDGRLALKKPLNCGYDGKSSFGFKGPYEGCGAVYTFCHALKEMERVAKAFAEEK